jgi:rhodanese-related sulfurtransferase
MLTRLSISLVALLFDGLFGEASADPSRLASIDADLQAAFTDIDHPSAVEFSKWRSQGRDVVLVDVRKSEEFAVSRIDGAIRIDPAASARDVAARLRDLAPGKPVVFYCSVGVRSSRLASRSQARLTELGAIGVYNLSGGVFSWHNEGRALVDARGQTPLVHPHGNAWRKLLRRKALISYMPRVGEEQ